MTPIFPGQGRVPYTPLPKKEPAYSGLIVVARDEGIVEEQPYGRSIKLLCNETVGDETFTLAERTYEPGRESQVVEKHDSEAVHILEGQGIYEAWPANVSRSSPQLCSSPCTATNWHTPHDVDPACRQADARPVIRPPSIDPKMFSLRCSTNLSNRKAGRAKGGSPLEADGDSTSGTRPLLTTHSESLRLTSRTISVRVRDRIIML